MRRRCSACGPRWVKKTRAALLSGLREKNIEGHAAFLTVTAPGEDAGLPRYIPGLPVDEAIEAWNEGAADRWNHLRTRLRQHWPRMEFFRVGELQKRGAIHYHILARNVAGLTREKLSAIAVECGFGPVADVRPLRHAGGAAAYLSKYFLKDVDEWPPGRRVWSCSNKWRVVWNQRVSGTWIMKPLSGADPWVSVPAYEFDLEETLRLRRLRATLLNVHAPPD